MTLNHSKTWPVSTLAVVQLRVDPHGRTYSTLTGNQDFQFQDRHEDSGLENEAAAPEGTENGDVYPISTKHLEDFTKMAGPPIRTTVRTDTVSTILEQDTEFDLEHHEEQGKCRPDEPSNSNLEKFHVLALTRIEENINESEFYALGRRPSIKVDNWDFIYTETKPNRCPIHSCLNEPAPKEPPELPLDARKTTTLRRHYYLEGGWGWVVVVCSVLVHVLNHGVQLSCSQLVLPGAEKFKVEAVHFAVFILSVLGLYEAIIANNNQKMDLMEKVIYIGIMVQFMFYRIVVVAAFPRKMRRFFEALNLLHSIDESISKIGAKISYKFLQNYGIASATFFLLHPLFLIINVSCFGKNPILQLAEYLCFGLPYIIIQVPIFVFLAYAIILWDRFKLLNQYFTKLNTKKFSKLFVKQRITLLTMLHQRLRKASQCLKETFSVAILILYLQYLQLLTALMFTTSSVALQSYFGSIFLMILPIIIQNFITGTIIQLIINESKKTSMVLMELDGLYRDKELKSKVNTLLLQMLHQEISYTLCGLFDFNLNKLIGVGLYNIFSM